MTLVILARPAAAVPLNFSEAGMIVSGFEDEFTGNVRDPNWTVFGPAGDVYSQPGDGYLHVTTGTSDPNKLLYDPPGGYDATNQNVLALVVMDNFGTVDGSRGGPTASSDPATGEGFNLHFRPDGQNGTGNHFNLLDDLRAWGPSTPGPNDWQLGVPMWLRLTTDGATVTGKVWAADSITPEPAGPSITWTRGDRSGLAGIAASSNDGLAEYRVDYILIQAEGLPQISAGNVIPEPASIVLMVLGIVGLATVAVRRRVGAQQSR